MSRHERVPDEDWQVPGLLASAMAAPQAASRMSGCHPRARERRHVSRGKGHLERPGGAGSPRVHTYSENPGLRYRAERRAPCRRSREEAQNRHRLHGDAHRGPPTGNSVALAETHRIRSSHVIQVRGVERIRRGQVPSLSGVGASPLLDLRLPPVKWGGALPWRRWAEGINTSMEPPPSFKLCWPQRQTLPKREGSGSRSKSSSCLPFQEQRVRCTQGPPAAWVPLAELGLNAGLPGSPWSSVWAQGGRRGEPGRCREEPVEKPVPGRPWIRDKDPELPLAGQGVASCHGGVEAM